ncbi:MAG: small multi-drug export protein [Methanoregula sp.]|nr:small multi-drug export protein [Methanoregula sp.]
MAELSIGHFRQFGTAIGKFLLIAIILPLIPVLILGLPAGGTLALMASTFVIEYGAGPVGIGLGLPPVFVLWVVVCVALGITLLFFDILDALAGHSARVSTFLARAEERAKRSNLISRHGIYGLIPGVMILGIYVCSPVSWILGGNRKYSVVLIFAGYTLAATGTILVTLGILKLFFT